MLPPAPTARSSERRKIFGSTFNGRFWMPPNCRQNGFPGERERWKNLKGRVVFKSTSFSTLHLVCKVSLVVGTKFPTILLSFVFFLNHCDRPLDFPACLVLFPAAPTRIRLIYRKDSGDTQYGDAAWVKVPIVTPNLLPSSIALKT